MRASISVPLFLGSLLVSTALAGAGCPQENTNGIAIPVVGGLPWLDLQWSGGRETFQATPVAALDGYLIYVSNSWLKAAKVREVKAKPTPCLHFTPIGAPYIDRLKDGKCYWVLKLNAKPTCWTLRVETVPLGYPFQVVAGQRKPLRQESNEDSEWNLERDLPRGTPATVEIFDLTGSKALLVISDIKFARLAGGDGWTVPKSDFPRYIAPGNGADTKQDLPVQGDALRARNRQLAETATLKEIRLRAVGAER